MYKFIVTYFLLLSVISFSVAADTSNQTPEIASQELTPYTVGYKATWKVGWFPITIDATRTLEKSNDEWKLSFEAYSSVADLSEISYFDIKQNQISPIRYRYKTSGFLSKKLRVIEFNREKNKVWLPDQEIWGNYDLTNEIQDNLSYQEQIRLDLMAGKTQLTYPVTYKNRLKSYEFAIVGDSKIKTPLGTFNATEVKQVGLDKDESNHIWLAKDYEYLIIKLKITKSNGTSNTIELKHAKVGNKVLTGA